MKTQNGILVVGLLLAFSCVCFLVFFFPTRLFGNPPWPLYFNELADEISEGNVARLVIIGDEIEVTFTDGTSAVSKKESDQSILDQLSALGVSKEALSPEAIAIEVVSPRVDVQWLFVGILLGSLIGGLIVFLINNLRNSGGKNDSNHFVAI